MLLIFPVPPTASCVESAEKASERIPPMEWMRALGSQVYMIGVFQRCQFLAAGQVPDDHVSYSVSGCQVLTIGRGLRRRRAWKESDEVFFPGVRAIRG